MNVHRPKGGSMPARKSGKREQFVRRNGQHVLVGRPDGPVQLKCRSAPLARAVTARLTEHAAELRELERGKFNDRLGALLREVESEREGM